MITVIHVTARTVLVITAVPVTAGTILMIATVPVTAGTVLVITTVPVMMVHCCTGRAVTCCIVMVVAIVSTVPTVTHTEMVGGVMMDVVVTTTVIPTSSSYDMPGMTATIGGVEYRATIVEVVTMGIAGIDAEVPETVCPVEGTIEIGGCAESA
jgi:hypothetical protein